MCIVIILNSLGGKDKETLCVWTAWCFSPDSFDSWLAEPLDVCGGLTGIHIRLSDGDSFKPAENLRTQLSAHHLQSRSGH